MLSKLKRARHYSLPDLAGIAGLWTALAAAEIYIRLSPAPRVFSRLKKTGVFPAKNKDGNLEKLLKLTEIADRQFGLRPHCLRKAVALKWIADFLRLPTEFKVGVARDTEGMHAHGWLECNGRRLENKSSGLPFEEMD